MKKVAEKFSPAAVCRGRGADARHIRAAAFVEKYGVGKVYGDCHEMFTEYPLADEAVAVDAAAGRTETVRRRQASAGDSSHRTAQ